LSNGEFVVNAAATAKHRPVLEAINSDRIPKFADGGMVGSPSSVPTFGGTSIVAPTIAVTVQGSAGQSSADHQRMGENIGKAAMDHVREMMAKELYEQRRPGGLLQKGEAINLAIENEIRRPSAIIGKASLFTQTGLQRSPNLPLLRQKPEQPQYSTSDELSRAEDEIFFDNPIAAANRGELGEEASDAEILAAMDDDKADHSANALPVQVDNSPNPNPAQVDNSAKKSRPVSLLRDAAFLRAIEGLFASGIQVNQGKTSVSNTFPLPSSLQAPSSPLQAPSRRTRSRTPWWRIFQSQPPRAYRNPAEWRDTSDQLRVLYRHLALKTFGPVHTLNVNLRPDIEALARRQPDQAGWFQARLVRRLRQQLGRSPEFHLTMEEGDQHRLHFHGEIQCSADEAENVRKALRLAGGEWKVAPQHQTKTDADPDHGWASYIADDIWRVGSPVRFYRASGMRGLAMP
jgi:hypothetical protein